MTCSRTAARWSSAAPAVITTACSSRPVSTSSSACSTRSIASSSPHGCDPAVTTCGPASRCSGRTRISAARRSISSSRRAPPVRSFPGQERHAAAVLRSVEHRLPPGARRSSRLGQLQRVRSYRGLSWGWGAGFCCRRGGPDYGMTSCPTIRSYWYDGTYVTLERPFTRGRDGVRRGVHACRREPTGSSDLFALDFRRRKIPAAHRRGHAEGPHRGQRHRRPSVGRAPERHPAVQLRRQVPIHDFSNGFCSGLQLPSAPDGLPGDGERVRGTQSSISAARRLPDHGRFNVGVDHRPRCSTSSMRSQVSASRNFHPPEGNPNLGKPTVWSICRGATSVRYQDRLLTLMTANQSEASGIAALLIFALGCGSARRSHDAGRRARRRMSVGRDCSTTCRNARSSFSGRPRIRENGLVPDRWPTPSFSSIAAVGFGLTAYGVGAERGWVTREAAAQRVLTTLRFFLDSKQGDARSGVTGYRGFYYHFVDMKTGERFKEVELSTIDTTLLLAGALFCQSYFDRDDADRARHPRHRRSSSTARAEWTFFLERPPLVSMGWTPENGLHDYDYTRLQRGHDPLHPRPRLADASDRQGVVGRVHEDVSLGRRTTARSTSSSRRCSDISTRTSGSTSAASRTTYMRAKGIDYFENSRRATYRAARVRDRQSDGVEGLRRERLGPHRVRRPGRRDADHRRQARAVLDLSRARHRAASEVRDDGTLAPTAAISSIAFTPEIAIPAMRSDAPHAGARISISSTASSTRSIRRSTSTRKSQHGTIVPGVGWFDVDYLGIDQGPIVAMIENHRSELVWKTMRKNAHVVRGLKRAGFTGGWLEAARRELKIENGELRIGRCVRADSQFSIFNFQFIASLLSLCSPDLRERANPRRQPSSSGASAAKAKSSSSSCRSSIARIRTSASTCSRSRGRRRTRSCSRRTSAIRFPTSRRSATPGSRSWSRCARSSRSNARVAASKIIRQRDYFPGIWETNVVRRRAVRRSLVRRHARALLSHGHDRARRRARGASGSRSWSG